MSSTNGWASVPTGTGAIGVGPNGPVARRRRRGIAVAAITALVAAGLAAATVTPAQAALPPPGPIDAVNGFPVSFSDGNITLGQCLDTVQCLANIELPVPDTPAVYPGNFPIEQFWFAASAATPTQIGLYEAALEGAYANDVVTAGEEVSFGRIRVILNAVVPGATYRVQHPYGEFTVTDGDALDERDPAGEIRVTDDLGCVAADIPCGAAGFAKAAASFLGNSVNTTSHFLTQNNPVAPTAADPRIRIGNLLVPGPVGGAPNVDALGQPINRVIVTGPNINPGAPNASGPNVTTLIQDQFNVQGALVGPAVVPSAGLAPTVTTSPSLATVNWQTPANGGSAITEYRVQAVDPVTGALVGPPVVAGILPGTSSNTRNVVVPNGTKVAFQVEARNAAGFGLPSARSAAVIPGTPNQQYVGRVYSDLFNRAPDPVGLATWTARLGSGTPRIAVANAITSSTEFRTKLIAGSYLKYLGRTPDAGGLNANLAAMRSGMTISKMESGFIASNEYFIRAGSTNTGWVTALYRDVLNGRTPSPAEVNFWLGRLSAGVPRSQVAMGFLLSTERLTTVVNEYYLQLLGRGLDPSGQATWVRILQAGGRNEAIIGNIIASPEYFAKRI